jgi:hypothetical protein
MPLVETLSVFIADMGVSATWNGGASQLVLFDQPDTDVLSKRVQTRGYKITFESTKFVGIKFGDAVVCNAMNFKVIQVNSLDDGAFYEAELEAT